MEMGITREWQIQHLLANRGKKQTSRKQTRKTQRVSGQIFAVRSILLWTDDLTSGIERRAIVLLAFFPFGVHRKIRSALSYVENKGHRGERILQPRKIDESDSGEAAHFLLFPWITHPPSLQSRALHCSGFACLSCSSTHPPPSSPSHICILCAWRLWSISRISAKQ